MWVVDRDVVVVATLTPEASSTPRITMLARPSCRTLQQYAAAQ
jgi:hypothetical protein